MEPPLKDNTDSVHEVEPIMDISNAVAANEEETEIVSNERSQETEPTISEAMSPNTGRSRRNIKVLSLHIVVYTIYISSFNTSLSNRYFIYTNSLFRSLALTSTSGRESRAEFSLGDESGTRPHSRTKRRNPNGLSTRETP